MPKLTGDRKTWLPEKWIHTSHGFNLLIEQGDDGVSLAIYPTERASEGGLSYFGLWIEVSEKDARILAQALLERADESDRIKAL